MNLSTVIATRPNKSIYRDGNLMIKVFDADYSKSDVLNEALNQARVEETGLPIPKLHEVTKIDGKWALISDFIEGETMVQLVKKNPEKFDEFLELFVNLQCEIHSKRAPLLTKLYDKMRRKIDMTDLSATTRYDLQMRLDSLSRHRKVCHGDYNPSNIIITPSGEPYIIDWAHATQGSASADAARTYLIFCLLGQNENAQKYITAFSKKSDIPRQHIEKWLPIVAASQMVKGKPEEKEFLHRWADVVDYE